MPEICRFLGIIIQIYYDDHNPPHFHARYGDKKGSFEISTLNLIEGNLPVRVRNLVAEWADMHKEELYPSEFKSWDLGPFKAPGLDRSKASLYYNTGRLSIVQPRELSTVPNPNF